MKTGLSAILVGAFFILIGTSNEVPAEKDLTPVSGQVAEVRRVIQEIKGVDVTVSYEIDTRRDDGGLTTIVVPTARIGKSDTKGLIGKRLTGKLTASNTPWVLKIGDRQIITYERTLRLEAGSDRRSFNMGLGFASVGALLMAFGYWRTGRRRSV